MGGREQIVMCGDRAEPRRYVICVFCLAYACLGSVWNGSFWYVCDVVGDGVVVAGGQQSNRRSSVSGVKLHVWFECCVPLWCLPWGILETLRHERREKNDFGKFCG